MQTQWGNFGPRVGVAWDPNGDGKTSVRASYGRSYEFVNAQFHLNTSVAPPWGSEIRLNAPPGGLDNPFLGSPGGQTNIFPVTFDQNAPFSLNGPFLSLSNDMASTHVDQWNVTVERQFRPRGSRRPAMSAAGPATSGNRRRSTTPCSRTSARRAPSAANINARRPFTLADPNNGKFYGPVDLYVTDGTQRYNGMLLSRAARGAARVDGRRPTTRCRTATARPTATAAARPTSRSATTSRAIPAFDDGNCTADRLQNFSMTASVRVAALRERAPAGGRDRTGGWRGSFRATTGPWLTSRPARIAAERSGGHAAGEPGVRRTLRRPVDQPGERRHPVPGSRRRSRSRRLGTLGTMERNIIRGPGSKNVDAGADAHLPSRRDARRSKSRARGVQRRSTGSSGATRTRTSRPRRSARSRRALSPRVLQLAVKFNF